MPHSEPKSPLTTLCYIERNGAYLMLHRVSKKNDENHGKWIGVGGHFEKGESPEDCLRREVREETGLELASFRFRGIVTFINEENPAEYMCLYTAQAKDGKEIPCDEGQLAWIDKNDIEGLNLWEGDRIFLRLLRDDAPFFSLKLSYRGGRLSEAVLDGKALDIG